MSRLFDYVLHRSLYCGRIVSRGRLINPFGYWSNVKNLSHLDFIRLVWSVLDSFIKYFELDVQWSGFIYLNDYYFDFDVWFNSYRVLIKSKIVVDFVFLRWGGGWYQTDNRSSAFSYSKQSLLYKPSTINRPHMLSINSTLKMDCN